MSNFKWGQQNHLPETGRIKRMCLTAKCYGQTLSPNGDGHPKRMNLTTTSHAEFISASVCCLEDCSIELTSKIATDPETSSG